MTVEEQRQISLVQLEIMDEIHRICTKHKITYYMIAGTLLGAVRHGGYIPWDLDIDIAMLREDYERFRQVCTTELGEMYRYLDHEVEPRYDRPHALISKKRTKLHLKYDHQNPETPNFGIYLDIFPLDNAPDEQRLRKKQAELLKRIRSFKLLRIPYSYSKKRWKRYAHYGVSFLLSWIPLVWINRFQQKQMKKYNGTVSTHVCAMASSYAYDKECMPREVYGEPVLLAFEGRQYYAPARYVEYLERVYGDYMQLPPLEKRKANFDVFTHVEFL